MSSSTDFPLDDFAGVLKPPEDGRDTVAPPLLPRADRGGGASELEDGSARGSSFGSRREGGAEAGGRREAVEPSEPVPAGAPERAEAGGALGDGSGRDGASTSGSRWVFGALLETGATCASRASAKPQEAHAAVPSTA